MYRSIVSQRLPLNATSCLVHDCDGDGLNELVFCTANRDVYSYAHNNNNGNSNNSNAHQNNNTNTNNNNNNNVNNNVNYGGKEFSLLQLKHHWKLWLQPRSLSVCNMGGTKGICVYIGTEAETSLLITQSGHLFTDTRKSSPFDDHNDAPNNSNNNALAIGNGSSYNHGSHSNHANVSHHSQNFPHNANGVHPADPTHKFPPIIHATSHDRLSSSGVQVFGNVSSLFCARLSLDGLLQVLSSEKVLWSLVLDSENLFAMNSLGGNVLCCCAWDGMTYVVNVETKSVVCFQFGERVCSFTAGAGKDGAPVLVYATFAGQLHVFYDRDLVLTGEY